MDRKKSMVKRMNDLIQLWFDCKHCDKTLIEEEIRYADKQIELLKQT